jgi:hypothetical protein
MPPRSDARPKDDFDPKDLIFEAYRIEGITIEECRSILIDWALSLEDQDIKTALRSLLARHADAPDDHPMTTVLRDGLAQAPAAKRRGGRAARLRH